MKWLKLETCSGLNGTVKIPGSKNSSLALMAAAYLSDEPIRLSGIPNIADVDVIQQIAQQIGLQMRREIDGNLYLDPRPIQSASIHPKLAAAFRSSYYFAGALLAKQHKVAIGYPGGDDFGSRPIDQHFKAFRAFGATVTLHNDYYEIQADSLKGAEIYFDMITCGATINSMLAAVRASGRTILRNAATDPEVVDTACFLNQIGAKIRGAGTDTITIDGVSFLHGGSYAVIPDRLLAGTFLIAAGATGGTVTVDEVIPEHLTSCTSKLSEIGFPIVTSASSITIYPCPSGKPKATRVRTAMYPGFATDLQQPLTALLTQVQGRSLIADKIYPRRFNHVDQLRRLGADIELRSGLACVKGGIPLKGNHVHATDVRAGICLLIAGLTAEGTTTISGVHHIERGYEHVVDTFRSMGAHIAAVDPAVDELGWGSDFANYIS